jgi:hypothetical protein
MNLIIIASDASYPHGRDIPIHQTSTCETSIILGYNCLKEINKISLNKNEKEFLKIFNRFKKFALDKSLESGDVNNSSVRAIISIENIIEDDKSLREFFGIDVVFTAS